MNQFKYFPPLVYVHILFLVLFVSNIFVTPVFAYTDLKAENTYNKLPLQIQQALTEQQVKPSQISIIVQKVMPKGQEKQKNTALISHLADRKRLPASTLKLFTTFSALDVLGKNFMWKTEVYHTGTIKKGVLKGDLIIKGGADPKLVKEHIIDLLQKVRAKGIKTINGNLVLDSSIFKLARHNPSAFDNKPLRPYNAGASGLLVNFSALVLHFTPNPENGTADISFEPIIADTTLPTSVALKPKGKCKQWRNGLQADFTNNELTFAGSYPENCRLGTWPIAHPDPAHFAKGVFKGNWLALDGQLTGRVTFSTEKNAYTKGKKPQRKVATQYSPLLSSIIKDINRYSNNVMTEQVFLSMPAFAKSPKLKKAKPVNYKKAKQWFGLWWQKRLGKTKLATPKITKASGLCNDCAINPMSLHALLHFAAHHPSFDTFKESLSVAGETGTVRNYRYRMKNSPAIGNAYLKTGTLDNVTSIAGYVNAESGQMYSVVVIINKKNAMEAKPVLDHIIDWVAKQ